MSFSNETELGFPIWSGTDTPKREDFNEISQIADEELLKRAKLSIPNAVNWDSGNSIVSKGTIGYQKLPSGITIQWGRISATQSGTDIIFPIAFTTLYVLLGTGQSSGSVIPVSCYPTSATQGFVRTSGADAPVNWIAIGTI